MSTANVVTQLEQEITSILRLQLGERGRWYYVSDQGEHGPYSFVEAVEKYHDMLDKTYQEKDVKLSRIRTLLSAELGKMIADWLEEYYRTPAVNRLYVGGAHYVADKLRDYLLSGTEGK